MFLQIGQIYISKKVERFFFMLSGSGTAPRKAFLIFRGPSQGGTRSKSCRTKNFQETQEGYRRKKEAPFHHQYQKVILVLKIFFRVVNKTLGFHLFRVVKRVKLNFLEMFEPPYLRLRYLQVYYSRSILKFYCFSRAYLRPEIFSMIPKSNSWGIGIQQSKRANYKLQYGACITRLEYRPL